MNYSTWRAEDLQCQSVNLPSPAYSVQAPQIEVETDKVVVGANDSRFLGGLFGGTKHHREAKLNVKTPSPEAAAPKAESGVDSLNAGIAVIVPQAGIGVIASKECGNMDAVKPTTSNYVRSPKSGEELNSQQSGGTINPPELFMSLTGSQENGLNLNVVTTRVNHTGAKSNVSRPNSDIITPVLELKIKEKRAVEHEKVSEFFESCGECSDGFSSGGAKATSTKQHMGSPNLGVASCSVYAKVSRSHGRRIAQPKSDIDFFPSEANNAIGKEVQLKLLKLDVKLPSLELERTKIDVNSKVPALIIGNKTSVLNEQSSRTESKLLNDLDTNFMEENLKVNDYLLH